MYVARPQTSFELKMEIQSSNKNWVSDAFVSKSNQRWACSGRIVLKNVFQFNQRVCKFFEIKDMFHQNPQCKY